MVQWVSGKLTERDYFNVVIWLYMFNGICPKDKKNRKNIFGYYGQLFY